MSGRGGVGLVGRFLDRVIKEVAPAAAARRMASRYSISVMERAGGYAGANRSAQELRAWSVRANSPDADTLRDLPTLRAFSRDLGRNDQTAAGARATYVTNVIGAGLRVEPAIDREFLGLSDTEADAWEEQAKRLWALGTETKEIDLARQENFAGLCNLAFLSFLDNGDSFALLTDKERPGGSFSLKVQLFEADLVRNPGDAADTEVTAGGIEADPETGEFVAVHIADRYLHDRRGRAAKWRRVPIYNRAGRRNVLHIIRRQRIGQRRGVPFMAPIIGPLKQLSRYSEAEIMAAVIASCFAIEMESKDGNASAGLAGEQAEGDGGKSDLAITRPGTIVDLGEGEKIKAFDPGRPNANFGPFHESFLRLIGMALEIPYEVLIKHFSSSYSASRAAIETAWQTFRTMRAWFVAEFCQPIYEALIDEAVARGWLHAPGYWDDALIRRAWLGTQWQGPQPPQLDELKAVKAARERVDMGVSDLHAEAVAMGRDWQSSHKQRVKEVRERRAAGLEPVQAAAGSSRLPSDTADDTEPDGQKGGEE